LDCWLAVEREAEGVGVGEEVELDFAGVVDVPEERCLAAAELLEDQCL
jgi:hypothetical protein